MLYNLTLCHTVRNFGIIGGGAVLFTGSAIAGAQTLLPLLGEMIIIYD